MQPIERTSTLQNTTAALRNALLSGEIGLGHRLTEERLAETLGVARATLRTALHLLANEGLVEQRPYRGWMAASLSAKDIWELYTLRERLETLAVELFLSGVEPKVPLDLEGLRRAFERACAQGHREEAGTCDAKLHRSIVHASGHSRLLAQYDLMSAQIQMIISSSNALVADLDKLFEQHEPIFAAIANRDVVSAKAAVAHHISTEGARLHREALAQERKHL